KKRTKCHQLFRTSNYEQHKDRNPDPVKGTCVWFLQHPNYISWRDNSNSSLLWVSADPGCGKSVLSKLLVDEELQATSSRITCYFFFKDDNEDQKTVTNALCAILHQMFEQKPELLKHAVEFHDKNGDKLTANVDLLWRLLLTASADPQAGEMICILDALDECREGELESFLPILCRFYQDVLFPAKRNLKFLSTSRPYYGIERHFTKINHETPTIRLAGEEETEKISHEINLVIEHNLTNLEADMRLNPATITSLRKEFTKVKHRTYLWLTLTMDLIRGDLQSVTKTGRQKIFSTLPASIDDAYTAILNRSMDKTQAKKLLQIVCAARYPLSVKETSIALSIQPDDKSYEDLDIHSEGFSKNMIRNLCGLFVTVIDGKVYLLHQTAKEFLMSENAPLQWDFNPAFDGNWKYSLSIQSSNFVLANSCMWYILLNEFCTNEPLKDKEIPQLVVEFDFLDYSAKYWAEHFRDASIPAEHSSVDFALELFESSLGRYRSWKSFYESSDLSIGDLHLAAHFGLGGVVSRLLAAPSIDVNLADDKGRTPLWVAAYYGHEAVVSQFLAVPSIDVNLADDGGRTPLWVAAFYGHEAVVSQFLAVPSIDVNLADDGGRTPLSKAASYGHEAIV
ncbi:hypothetical protein BDZ45DRAFT_554699, partial [Acephala macrosclerotiorum]